MIKEQTEVIVKLLKHINQILNDCLSQHDKFIHDLTSSKEEMEQSYQQLLALFIYETSGRSLKSGLSETQILLTKSIESLYECKTELEKHLKRMKYLNVSILEEGIDTLEKMTKAHPDGQA